MDQTKKPAKEGEEKKTGFTFDMKNIGSFTQMLGGFTVLRMTSMVAMVGISFNKEELLAMNAKLNKIKCPKKK